MKKESEKIKELEKRIEDFEKRPQFIPVYPAVIPSMPTQSQGYFCQICKSWNCGQTHVVC